MAPARIRCQASSAFSMPPTPTRTRRSPTRAYRRRRTSRERSLTGAPDRPPVSFTREGADFRPRPSRAMVVLVAMMPSRPSSSARSATASTSSSARSGAILTSSGTRRSATVRSAASRTAVSSGRRDSVAWRLRRPGVFGEETLTTR
ncbi:hypothetical protein SF23_01750 [Streptomyces sp. MBRL 10]|nr:hypothetical protein SF23_01750 [Streptomyces sp. MBRL 10]